MNASDVAQHDPIIIKFAEPGTRILDIRSETSTRDVISAKAVLENNSILLSFEFLDRDDGITLEAFYDNEDAAITHSGTIKGLPKGIQLVTQHSSVQAPVDLGTPGSFLAFSSVIPFAVTVGGIVALIQAKGKPDRLVVATTIVLGVLGMSMLVRGLYTYFQNRIPRKLRVKSEVEYADVEEQSDSTDV